ncbi:MAG: diacylglycerol kinase family protein [Chloroflexi bacterium]|nr:diacylglycerol kinase family protein [Chloroflexota bacterium]
MRGYIASRRESFRWAFAGVAHVLRSQRNAWIHAAATVLVVAMSAWLRLAQLEWALVVVAIAAVWIAEIANTALEAVVDLVAPEPHPLARTAKDCAAGAVLVASGMAVVVGLLVLGPPLWDRLGA